MKKLLFAIIMCFIICCSSVLAQITSISEIDYVMSDKFLKESAFTVEATVSGGTTEKLVGTFPKEEIKDSESGAESLSDFTLEFEALQDECEYPIVAVEQPPQISDKFIGTGNHIYRAVPTVGIKLGLVSTDLEIQAQRAACNLRAAGGPWYIHCEKPTWSFNTYCWCMAIKDTGIYGRLQNPTDIFGAKVKLSVPGKLPISINLNSKNETTAFMTSNGENIAHLLLEGGLSTGESCPDPFSQQDISAYWDLAYSRWILTRESNWQALRNSKLQALSDCMDAARNKWFGLKSTMDREWAGCANAYNLFSNFVTSSSYRPRIQNPSKTISSSPVSYTTFEQGNIKLGLEKTITNSKILLRIKAGWLGVKVPSGEPKIVSLEKEDDIYHSGTFAVIKGVFTNTGESESGFRINLDCISYISQVGSEILVTIAPGDTKEVNIPYVGSFPATVSTGCTVKMTDVNAMPPKTSTKSISITGTGAGGACIDGTPRAVGTRIEECKNGVWIVVKDCGDTPIAFTDDGLRCETLADLCKERPEDPSCRACTSCVEWMKNLFGEKKICVPEDVFKFGKIPFTNTYLISSGNQDTICPALFALSILSLLGSIAAGVIYREEISEFFRRRFQ